MLQTCRTGLNGKNKFYLVQYLKDKCKYNVIFKWKRIFFTRFNDETQFCVILEEKAKRVIQTMKEYNCLSAVMKTFLECPHGVFCYEYKELTTCNQLAAVPL